MQSKSPRKDRHGRGNTQGDPKFKPADKREIECGGFWENVVLKIIRQADSVGLITLFSFTLFTMFHYKDLPPEHPM